MPNRSTESVKSTEEDADVKSPKRSRAVDGGLVDEEDEAVAAKADAGNRVVRGGICPTEGSLPTTAGLEVLVAGFEDKSSMS